MYCLTFESPKRPPPTIIAEMAVPMTAKMMIEPMFLKKFPCVYIQCTQVDRSIYIAITSPLHHTQSLMYIQYYTAAKLPCHHTCQCILQYIYEKYYYHYIIIISIQPLHAGLSIEQHTPCGVSIRTRILWEGGGGERMDWRQTSLDTVRRGNERGRERGRERWRGRKRERDYA